MKELQLHELSVRQKLGLCMTGHIYAYKGFDAASNTEYALEMIRQHALGAIWVDPSLDDLKETMARIREADTTRWAAPAAKSWPISSAR